MIKKNEVRIGNHVSITGHTFKILGIEDVPVLEMENGSKFVKQALWEDLEPTPVTEPLLVSYGFSNDRANGGMYKSPIHLIEKGNGWFLMFDGWAINLKPMTGAHEIQNFYYAVSGVELIQHGIIEHHMNDLRVSNLIEYKNGVVPIMDITEKQANLRGEGGLKMNGQILNVTFKGVELTEDWYHKLGFKVSEIIMYPKFSQFYFLKEDAGYFMRTKDGNFYINRMNPIRFVHQLQNLFFVITGEELL